MRENFTYFLPPYTGMVIYHYGSDYTTCEVNHPDGLKNREMKYADTGLVVPEQDLNINMAPMGSSHMALKGPGLHGLQNIRKACAEN